MSYEGYEQHVCENGHRFDIDCHGIPTCPICSAKSFFCNSVDQTNGPSEGEIPDTIWNSVFKLTDAEFETCNHCNHTKLVKEATYRIPYDKKEVEPYRVYSEETAEWMKSGDRNFFTGVMYYDESDHK